MCLCLHTEVGAQQVEQLVTQAIVATAVVLAVLACQCVVPVWVACQSARATATGRGALEHVRDVVGKDQAEVSPQQHAKHSGRELASNHGVGKSSGPVRRVSGAGQQSNSTGLSR